MTNLKNFWSNYNTKTLVCIALLACTTRAGAMSDSATVNKHSPRKATILSAILPGAGQVYNKKIWKVPVIYAGFGALSYSLAFNQGEYKRFRLYYKQATDGDSTTIPDFPGSEAQLRSKRDYYKKYRDLTIIGMFALYAVQIVDAHVDAHLMFFDINDDLSFQWSPAPLVVNPAARPQTGLNFSLRFNF